MCAMLAESDMWNSMVRATIPAIVAIVFVVCRRWFPARSVSTTVQDEKSFGKARWVLGPTMVGVGVLFAVVSYYALLWSNHFLALRGEKSVFLLLPSPWMWGVFPAFGAICCSWEITLRLWRRFGDPSQARKYQDWANSKSGFDTTRVLRIMIVFLGFPVGVATVLALPLHTAIGETEIRIGRFGTLRASNHSYSEIKRIVVTDGRELRNGSVYHEPAVILYFDDGSGWNSADSREPDDSIASLIAFIQGKTRIRVEYVHALPFNSL
jgi:hypothetical protein